MSLANAVSRIDRRVFLRGARGCLALPVLDYFLPSAKAFAQGVQTRIIYCYLPNGAQWSPSATGGSFALPSPLQDLGGLMDYLTVISGLKLGPAIGHIAGDHSRAQAAYLTGKTCDFPGPNVGRSIDRDFAEAIGKTTKVGSLCLTGEGYNSGESGYAPEYQTYLSWLGGQSPNSRDVDPAVVFDRPFGGATSPAAAAADPKSSVLDAVLEQAQALGKVLGQSDQNKLGEYMQSLRDLEQRLAASSAAQPAASTCTGLSRPYNSGSYDQRIGLFYDVLYHAIACGQTNVATFLLAGESSNQSYEFAGVHGGHHEISHDSSAEGYAKLAQIVRWHVGQLGKFCERLRQTSEAGGNALDHTVVVLGGGLGDGARHTHDNLPVLLLGKGGGLIRGHQHLRSQETPFMNLQLTLARCLGLNWSAFGDSSGTLDLG